MSNNYVQVPANSSGSKLQTVQNTVGGNTVDATCVAVVTSAGASCDPPSGTGVAVLGNVNSNSADSGSPLKVGAVFTAWGSLPAAATGSRLDAQCDPAGTRKVGVAPLGTPLYGSNNVVAANSAVTLTIPSAKMGFLDGFDVDGVGATTGSGLTVTVAGLLGGTLTYILPVVAGNTTPNPTFSKRFNPPLQASATNTNIVISVPSFGTGSPGQSLNAYAHYA